MNRKQRRAESKSTGLHALPPASQQAFAAALQLHKTSRIQEAEHLFNQIIARHPNHSDSLHLLGIIAYQTRRPDLAATLIRKVITLNPNDASAHSNLGNLLLQQGKFEDAVTRYRKSIALNPAFGPAHNNMGNALRALKQFDASIESFQNALELNPNDPEAHYNFSMVLLATGDYPAGWAQHEWRFKTPQLVGADRKFPQPQWQGEAAAGKTLLIHAEQGFGDSLQFCRFIPQATEKNLRIILEVPQPLIRLFKSLPGIDQLIANGDPLPAFDLHCPMMSLPHALKTTLANLPATTPYLCADPQESESWHARLQSLNNPNPRIGLVWAGNPRRQHFLLEATDKRRSIPVEQLAPLFTIPNLHFISLQKDGPPPPANFPLTDFMPEIQDWAATAALMENLDLIISVDTAPAHLAGALNKPVWLLDRFDPCWRWLHSRTDSPWYLNHKIYRQPKPGDWTSVITNIRPDLATFSLV